MVHLLIGAQKASVDAESTTSNMEHGQEWYRVTQGLNFQPCWLLHMASCSVSARQSLVHVPERVRSTFTSLQSSSRPGTAAWHDSCLGGLRMVIMIDREEQGEQTVEKWTDEPASN